jgi:radical SAM protein with 4Fe4S-binding SPASM domain
MKTPLDLKKVPWTAIWETTQACDIACLDYGDCIQPDPDPLELTTQEGEQLVREVAVLEPRIFLMTGADPLKRADLEHLVRYAALHGLRPVLALRATPLLTRNAIARLKTAGLARITLTLNGSHAELHDLLCGVHGSFERTIQATQWAEAVGLPFQITTNFCERNLHDLEKLAALIRPFRPAQWNVTFPVPVRPAQMEEMPSPGQFEEAFARLYKLAQSVPFKVRTTEAPHYRRFVLQQQAGQRAKGADRARHFEEGIPGVLRVNEERATVFISHTGEVYPCALLPIAGGNIRIKKLAEIYRGADIFRTLHDSGKLRGKCSLCSFKQVCGGSRSRALAILGDVLAEDPACIYHPPEPARVRNAAPRTLPPVKIAVDPQG